MRDLTQHENVEARIEIHLVLFRNRAWILCHLAFGNSCAVSGAGGHRARKR